MDLDEHKKVIGRVLNHLSEEQDQLSTLIRGHLLVEEQLNAALRASVQHPAYVEKANLNFKQLTNLVKAEKFKQADSWLWGAIDKLNNIRNDLAHKLEPAGIDTVVEEFLQLVHGHYQFNDAEDQLRRAIAMVVSQIYRMHTERVA